jgi:hypothetical protein
MAYVPNPADSSQPQDNQPAKSAAAEFRALKQYLIDELAPVTRRNFRRQCVRSGSTNDAQGSPDFLFIGTGKNLNLKDNALHMSFAAGYNASGDLDFNTTIAGTAVTGIFSTPPLSDTRSYIFADLQPDGTVTWGHTIIPPHYYHWIDLTRQCCMTARGVNGGVPYDDFGFAWDTTGVIDTSQAKFGTGSVRLNGSSDKLSSNLCHNLGENSWTIDAHFRFAVLPTAGNSMTFFHWSNTSGFGVRLDLTNNAGTLSTRLYVSNSGGAWNVINAGAGSNTTWAIDTWYHLAVVFDDVNSKYIVYKDGTADYTNASAALACEMSVACVGATQADTNRLNGWVTDIRMVNACRFPNGTTFAVPTTQPVTEGSFFVIKEMLMYVASGIPAPSGGAMDSPPRRRLFVGEFICSAVGVTFLNLYRYNAEYLAFDYFGLTVNTVFSRQHNLGYHGEHLTVSTRFRILNNPTGWQPKDMIIGDNMSQYDNAVGNSGYTLISRGRITFLLSIGASLRAFRSDNATPNSLVGAVGCYLSAERKW